MGPFDKLMISSWYGDKGLYVGTNNPWFIRNGDYNEGTRCGIYTFQNLNGNFNSAVSFRVVLTPEE